MSSLVVTDAERYRFNIQLYIVRDSTIVFLRTYSPPHKVRSLLSPCNFMKSVSLDYHNLCTKYGGVRPLDPLNDIFSANQIGELKSASTSQNFGAKITSMPLCLRVDCIRLCVCPVYKTIQPTIGMAARFSFRSVLDCFWIMYFVVL